MLKYLFGQTKNIKIRIKFMYIYLYFLVDVVGGKRLRAFYGFRESP